MELIVAATFGKVAWKIAACEDMTMIGTRFSRPFALLVTVAIAFSVSGPAAAQDDDEARAVIAQALALLGDADSYAYTVQYDTSTALTDEAGDVFGTGQQYDITGESSGADFQDTTTITVTPLENEDDLQTTTVERVQADGTLYVLLSDLLADQLGVEAG